MLYSSLSVQNAQKYRISKQRVVKQGKQVINERHYCYYYYYYTTKYVCSVVSQ